MKTLLALAAALAVIIGSSIAAEIPPPAVQDTSVVKQAKELRVAKVEFRDTALQEAIGFIMQKARAVDPQQKGVNIALAAKPDLDATVTMSLADVSVYDVLQVIAGQVGLELQPADTVIMLGMPKF